MMAALDSVWLLLVRSFLRGIVLAFDFREPLEFVGMDLSDAMLDGVSVDFFGVLTIANLAIDADELALLQSLRKARKIAPGVDPVPLGAAFVVALVVLPAVLGGDAQDNVLLLVLVCFGFSVVTDATDEKCA